MESSVIALEDQAAEWVLETWRFVEQGEDQQPRFRTVTDKDGLAWWIWKRHIHFDESYRRNFPSKSATVKEKLCPYTLEHCIQDWHQTIHAVPSSLTVAINPANHRIRNVNTGEVIPCAALA